MTCPCWDTLAVVSMGSSSDWNKDIIFEFRRNHGRVGGYFEGAPLLLINHTGARTGKSRTNPVMYFKDGNRYLPIWIGAVEATAIAFALQGVVTARPMTHDLMKNILEELAVSVSRILITELREGTFYSTIEMARNGTRLEISSRPSDAIALAVRLAVPIYAHEDVLGEASIVIGERDGQAIIPRRALRGNEVFVIEAGRVVTRKVQVGFLGLNEAEILNGLRDGERVIVENLDQFQAGDRVRTKELK